MQEPNQEDTERAKWIHVGIGLAVASALEPLEYSRTLIQIGYEPVAAKKGVSVILRKPANYLPNIFSYMGHIRKTEGFFGLYRGLTPKLAGHLFSIYFTDKIADSFDFYGHEIQRTNQEVSDEEQQLDKITRNLQGDLIITNTSIILGHPFHVISVRMMAQFIGKETLYSSLYSSIIEIYKENGILGFFSGLIPILMFNTSVLVLSSSTYYLLKKYVINENVPEIIDRKGLFILQLAFNSIFYPMLVVSTCMMVTGSRLAAGNEPHMPVYNHWRECWSDLQSRNELKRGSSLFFRIAPN